MDLTYNYYNARGIDLNGDRVTFASNTYKGLEESHRLLMELAQNHGIEFVGYNALYVLVDSDQIMDIQNDNLTFLLDTSSVKDSISRATNGETNNEVVYPHSLAWEIEDLY